MLGILCEDRAVDSLEIGPGLLFGAGGPKSLFCNLSKSSGHNRATTRCRLKPALRLHSFLLCGLTRCAVTEFVTNLNFILCNQLLICGVSLPCDVVAVGRYGPDTMGSIPA